MKEWLKNSWNQLASNYSDDESIIDSYWQEIESKYSSKNRHYHSLVHIHNMLKQAESYIDKIVDYDALCFAIWYHDVIYKGTKSNNEEKSAEFAVNRLKTFKIDEKRLNSIEKLIISTKKHQILILENDDNSFLLDFDLSILGTNWQTYQTYIHNIREEYRFYPDFVYNKGRKKVLTHFLERDYLYFTNKYRDLFEMQARENLRKEIENLN